MKSFMDEIIEQIWKEAWETGRNTNQKMVDAHLKHGQLGGPGDTLPLLESPPIPDYWKDRVRNEYKF
jgi:hypothetical protein